MNKKVFISTDIEGVTGASNWNETEKTHPDYTRFQKIMNKEVSKICEVLTANKIDNITVRDAHDSARNIEHSELPANTKLISQFNGHIDQMMFGLDSSFNFSILHGYHAPAGSDVNPLAHTMCRKLLRMTINDVLAGEVSISIYTALLYGAPVCYICGDKGAIEEAQKINKNIIGTVSKEGYGTSTISKHPKLVLEEIEKDLKEVVDIYNRTPQLCKFDMPKNFKVDIEYKEHHDAYRFCFYPNTKLVAINKISFEADNFVDVLRFIKFCS